MLGWKLFLRAVTLVADNLGAALRIGAVPYGLVAAASVWLSATWPDLASRTTFDPGADLPGGFLAGWLLVSALTLLAYLWIAVAWHRFVLLGETPAGWLPPLRGGLMLGYLGRSLLIGIVVILIVLAVTTIASVLLLPLFGPAASPVIGAVAFFAAMIFFYRTGVILPAGTVERPMGLNDALIATRGRSGTVVVLALLTVAVSLLLQVPLLMEGSAGPVSAVYQAVTGWIGLMLGVGTLTALYGHLVEGRPVD